MSTASEEDERRKRSLEAGKDLLEKYKTARSVRIQARYAQTEEQSEEESCHHNKSIDPKGSFMNEGISSRDVTQSSVSMSEGEADRDLEGMAGRVAELEELLQGKEIIVEALSAEIDNLRGEASSPNSSQSQNSSINSRDVICLYGELEEYKKAINQRNNVIDHLTSLLEEAESAKDALMVQLSIVNTSGSSNSKPINDMNLQEKIDTLESTLNNQKAIINKLNSELAQIREHVQTLEMEKETRNAEISDYKVQINNLNEQIRLGAAEKNLNIAEMLEQQKQYEARVDKIKQDMQHILEKFTAETNANTARHQQELKDLATKHDIELRNSCIKYEEHIQSLKEENKQLADRLNKELPDLESKHAKELSVFQAQLAQYKKTVETLKLELMNRSESQNVAQAELNSYKSKFEETKVQAENARCIQELNHQKEKELLNEQIELHKIQLEELTSKYVAVTTVLESKESIERSLEQALTNAATLKQENDSLKFKLDDLSSRYSAAQSLIENTQAHERSMNSRIYDLEKSLSRLSGVNASMLSELNETTYQTMDEVTIKYHLTKQKLEEKEEMEKLLIEKIRNLEEDTEKAKKDLEQVNLVNRSYEKQLKDTKNMCDKLESEVATLKESKVAECNSSTDLARKLEYYEDEMKNLKILVDQKESEKLDYMKKLNELTEKMKRSKDECEQLKAGLATAWAQCAETEEKLNQTLAISDANIDISLPLSEYCATLPKHFGLNKTVDDSLNLTYDPSETANKLRNIKSDERIKHLESESEKQQSDYDEISNKLQHYVVLCEKLESEKELLVDENRKLKSYREEVNLLRKMLDELEPEKKSLQKQLENLTEQHKEEINAIRTESTSEIKAIQTLLLNVKAGNIGLTELKAELEARHAKEMEELRTYFEQKCLQMEKQYSEEIFSQQSKKMSDNDSEIEELAEDLYFGGAGDCLSVSNIGNHSRIDTPTGAEDAKCKNSAENSVHLESINESSIKALHQELENKILEIQNMKLNYEKSLEEQKNLYEKQLQEAKERIGRVALLRTVHQNCQTDFDVGTLETCELSKLRAAYDRQLEEQVALARLDIVNALQEQIQALLMVENEGEDNWPRELLELRDRLTNNAKQQIQQIKQTYTAEIIHLKEEHAHNVAIIVDRHNEEVKKIKAELTSKIHDHEKNIESLPLAEKNISKERDNLYKMCATLKDLVGELIKYFTVCEEEVNNTLINEVLKKQVSPLNLEHESKLRENDSLQSSEAKHTTNTDSNLLNSPEIKIKRVHFAPHSEGIMSLINSDNDTFGNMIDSTEDITGMLKNELNSCLHRLKLESAEIFNLPLSPEKVKFDALSKEVAWANKKNEELTMKLNHAEALILDFQEETEQLKMNIIELQRKLMIAENKKEIITEGYGEHDESRNDITLQDFSQLQEKARHVLSNGGGDCAYLLQLIEELCTQSDKLIENARKDKEDLQQQIEAADKQLRATRTFLEEQAAEREAERDESVKQIRSLKDQLKEREREKERDQRITSETSLLPEPSTDIPVIQAIDISKAVEALESQMREMSSLISDTEAKKSETESELKAAVDKIWVLRDIVTDLEQQLQGKIEREESLQLQISQLEAIIAAQTKNQQDLVQELDAIKMGEESRQLNEHITHLQEELAKHKLSSEHFDANSSVLKQMKIELRDMLNQLDRRIKTLESLNMCDSNLSISQPSEDVSIREQIDAARCPTPDDPNVPPILPLDQILRLKEKMLKHTRMEEGTFKRMKDLEMQLTTLKSQNEELQAELEILQQTASDRLYQVEAMRGRLEQHKQSAPFVQRQATSRLELELHEANAKLQSLEQCMAEKELELKDLKSQLNRTNQLLLEKESEIANVVQVEGTTIQKLKDRLEVVEEEKKILQSKVGLQEQTQLELPQLIDTMLADKNEEIDHLKEQLSKKEKQLEMYTSLPLDETQLRELTKHAEPKNSARTLSDILSIHSECEDVAEAIRSAPNLTSMPHNISSFKVSSASARDAYFQDQSKDALDTSNNPLTEMNNMNMREVPPLDLGSHSQSFISAYPHNSQPTMEVDSLQKVSSSESATETKTCAESERVTTGLTEKDSNKKETENEAVRMRIEELEAELNVIKNELQVKTEISNKRENELLALQKQFDELQQELKETSETMTRDRHFYKTQYELMQASENKIKKDLLQVENTLKLKNEELQEIQDRVQVNEKIITELNAENTKLKKSIRKKDSEELSKYLNLLQEKSQEQKNLQDILAEKEITIETIQTRNMEIENENKQLYEYKTRCHICEQELKDCQSEIQRLTDGLNNRDQIIRRLEEMARRSSASGTSSPSDCKDQEIHHLQEYIKEKDKVIRQMSDDSKSLHRALETIQSKMKESGNVVELRKKLKEEQKYNAELRVMIEKLHKELEALKKSSATPRSQDDSDIEDMVQRELNLSLRLDKQIMSAIDSDAEEDAVKEERASSNASPCPKETNDEQLEMIARKCAELKLKLRQADKVNEELSKARDDLEVEKEMLKFQLVEYENRIFQLKSDLTKESSMVTELDKKLSTEKNAVRSLKLQLEKDRRNMQISNDQQAELVDFLQAKLKSSLEIEEKLRNEISVMRQEYKKLEAQLSSMREHIEYQKSEELPGLMELLQNEQKKYITLVEQYEKEQRNGAELKDSLKKTESEKSRYEKELEIALEEKETLVSSLVLVEGIKEQLETDLRRSKEELRAKEEECNWLQKRIDTMLEAESKRQEHVSSKENEIKRLRRELSNSREVMMDLEADMKQSKRELKEALECASKLIQNYEVLKVTEVELTEKLSASREEEKKMKEVIADLQQKLKVCVKKVLDLTKEVENRFPKEEGDSAKYLQKIKELNDANEKYVNERSILHLKLTKAREEKEQLLQHIKELEILLQQNKHLSSSGQLDNVEKAQHFYGKYLRADSRRKALIFQKRYLLCVVGGYQVCEENTLSMLARLTQTQRSHVTKGHHRNAKVRFRRVALVIISITRMKRLVLRWRVGRRVGANALLSNTNQQYVPLRPSLQQNHSPPVREKSNFDSDAGLSDFNLEQYYQRLRNVQETLKLAMAGPTTLADNVLSD